VRHLPDIHCYVCRWKNFENRSAFGKVISKINIAAPFFRTRCIYTHQSRIDPYRSRPTLIVLGDETRDARRAVTSRPWRRRRRCRPHVATVDRVIRHQSSNWIRLAACVPPVTSRLVSASATTELHCHDEVDIVLLSIRDVTIWAAVCRPIYVRQTVRSSWIALAMCLLLPLSVRKSTDR